MPKKILFKVFFLLLFLTGQNYVFSNQEISQDNNISLIVKEENKEERGLQSKYLLGPGDALYIEFKGVQLFSGEYGVNFKGEINLPEIGKFNVSGKTIDELRKILFNKYNDFIIDPDIQIFISKFRTVKFYLGGEVRRPGLYSLDYKNTSTKKATSFSQRNFFLDEFLTQNDEPKEKISSPPKIFEAIKKGKGITKFADLSNIEITRLNSESQGGGKIKTSINLLTLIQKGDQSQNIKILDGDYIFIPKSAKLIRDQLLEINKTNLTPDIISVYVNGNITMSGRLDLPQGATLIEAIATAGGKKSYTGYIEFIRFEENGKTEKRIIKYSPNVDYNSPNNPLLMDGDIIVVRKNLLGKTTAVLNDISSPVITGFGLYSIFN